MKMNKKNTAWILSAAALFMSAVPAQAAVYSGPILLPLEYLNDYDEDPYTCYGTGLIRQIGLDEDAAEEYPALAKKLDELSTQDREELAGQFEEFTNDAREARDEGGMEYEASVEREIYPARWDENVFSYLMTYSAYSGGAHGYYGYTGMNIDPASGNEITAQDVFTDEEALKAAIMEALEREYPDLIEAIDPDPLAGYGFDDGDTPFNFLVDPAGVTVIFNPYEIASYAAGAQFAAISFDEHPELFREPYKAQEGSYTKMINTALPVLVDADGDGKSENLSVAARYGDYMQIDGYTVKLGDQETDLDSYCYSLRPFLARTEDGHTFLYVEITSDNDYRLLEVFDLSSGTPEYKETFQLAPASERDSETGVYTLFWPVDPGNMLLSARSNILSTYSGSRHYSADAEEVLKPAGERFTVSDGQTLTTVKELPALLVDPVTGEEGEKVTVPAGEKLTITGTDGEKDADLTGEDGRIFRVTLEETEIDGSLIRTIDGERPEEYFEMLYYAG